jgi:O-antigen ligase
VPAPAIETGLFPGALLGSRAGTRSLSVSALPGLPLYGLLKAIAASILFCNGLADLPRSIPVGPVTGHAILTIAYYFAGLLFVVITPVLEPPKPSKTLPLVFFLFWGATSLAWTPSFVDGFQNLLALGTMPLLLTVGEATASTVPGFSHWVIRCLDAAAFTGASIYAASVVFWGAGTDAVITARSFGLFAVYGVASQLVKWRYGRKSGLLWAAAITVLIGVSESRLMLGIAVVLFPLAQIPAAGLRRCLRVAVVTAVVAGLSYGAFNYFDALRDRFLKGDVSLKVGDISINGSGRAAFWRTTLESWSEAPVWGKGAGSSEGLIESVFITVGHPHNDYLRILHDYGIIGETLWIVAISTLLVCVWRTWRRADVARQKERAPLLVALLMLVAFALSMTAENVMVIAFVTAPVGLVVGSALGAARARRIFAQLRSPQLFARRAHT